MAKNRTERLRPQVLIERGDVPWLIAVAAATSVPHAAHLPAWLTALAAAAMLGRLWSWQHNARLPPCWLLSIFAVVGVAAIGWQFRTLLGRDAGVALLVFFVALKPMEIHTRRDALVVVMLGYFLLLTHYFYSESIPTALWMLAAATLVTGTLLRLYGGPQPAREILGYAARLLAQAAPLMIVLFVLFPRVEGPLWGLPRDAHAGLTGLSDTMAPGSINSLIQSGEIAFRVRFVAKIPEKSSLYWRGPVLDDYDGQTWRGGLPRSAALPPDIEMRGERIDYVSTLEPHGKRWLLALDLPVSLPRDSALSPAFVAVSREPIVQRRRYALASTTAYTVNAQEARQTLQRALRLPPTVNPRARELAHNWATELETPERISDRALALFRHEDFVYTLQPPLLGANAVDEFLFSTRRGFCEHFASAYVFLMRAAGVPARVVTGYMGGEVNPVDGYLTVRQSDAHAWAEIWVAGRGWLRVDPTAAVAPSRIESGVASALSAAEPLPGLLRLDNPWLRALRYRWEAAGNAWNQWVLGYNPDRQYELLTRLGLEEPDWRKMTAWLAVLTAAVLLVLSISMLRPRRAELPEQRAWRQFCHRLARFGVARAEWEGPLDFAQRVSRERPELGPLTLEAAKNFAAVRYGAGGPDELKRLRACRRRLPSRWRKTN